MKYSLLIPIVLFLLLFSCQLTDRSFDYSEIDKIEIQNIIQQEINEGVEATKHKDIDLYMSQMPDDLVIYDKSGEVITKKRQRAYVLRDWAIIDTTLSIEVTVDSIQYLKEDSIIVFTSQRWERIMFQKDGVNTDTVLTTQKHREVWKKKETNWMGYEVGELGGKIFINGNRYYTK